VENYNSGSSNEEEYFRQLTEFFRDLEEEDRRHIRENLSREELALFDILTRPQPKLTGKTGTTSKNAAKELLETLKENKLVLDWRKKTRTKRRCPS